MAKTPRTWTGARTPSGLKRVRQAQSRHEVLQPRRSAAKTYVARALAAVPQPADSSIDPAAALAEALSALDRAAKVGAIHPNAAARRKSRLTLKVNAALGGTIVQSGGRVVKTTGKAAAAKAAKVRIAAGKAGKAKGAQTAAGKARAALSKTARAEAAAAKAAAEASTTAPPRRRRPRHGAPPRPRSARRRRRRRSRGQACGGEGRGQGDEGRAQGDEGRAQDRCQEVRPEELTASPQPTRRPGFRRGVSITGGDRTPCPAVRPTGRGSEPRPDSPYAAPGGIATPRRAGRGRMRDRSWPARDRVTTDLRPEATSAGRRPRVQPCQLRTATTRGRWMARLPGGTVRRSAP